MNSDLWARFEVLISLIGKHPHVLSRTGEKLLFKDAGGEDLARLKSVGLSYDQTGEGIEIYVDGNRGSRLLSSADILFHQNDYAWFKDDFIIIQPTLYYSAQDARFLNESRELVERSSWDNHVAFLWMKQILISKPIISNSTDDSKLHFASYHDVFRRKIVIISGAKGVLYIGYPLQGPRLEPSIDLRQEVVRLNRNLDAKGYPELFKQELYGKLKEIPEGDRLEGLARNLKLLLDNADGSFEIYMTNFSMDALRDRLRQEKIRYYNATREVLSKVYGQITAVTIVVSASSIATSSVQKSEIILLLCIPYLVYTVFVLILLRVLEQEIGALRMEFAAESRELQENSKLSTSQIALEIGAINTRFNSTSAVIRAFRAVFIILTLMFIGYAVWRGLEPIPASDIPDSRFLHFLLNHLLRPLSPSIPRIDTVDLL